MGSLAGLDHAIPDLPSEAQIGQGLGHRVPRRETRISERHVRAEDQKTKPKWRNGRRGGLKIRFPQGSVGSNPTFGTAEKMLERAI